MILNNNIKEKLKLTVKVNSIMEFIKIINQMIKEILINLYQNYKT
jgi:hypothetical protein